MPIKKKLFPLEDDTKVWVRQASGLEKLKIEGIHATAMRKCRHFGTDMAVWTTEQEDEFWEIIEDLGGGMTAQIEHLIPLCLMDMEDGSPSDVNLLKSEEIIPMLSFIRGDNDGDAIPLGE
jgi:hypothetical protein